MIGSDASHHMAYRQLPGLTRRNTTPIILCFLDRLRGMQEVWRESRNLGWRSRNAPI